MKRWDIFCRIVDNYGDIGVCWRLARPLAYEHGIAVRLWVDNLGIAKRLISDLDVGLENQTIDSVEICHWTESFEESQVADVVIEAFACELPASYLAAMAQTKPVWLNLEYLSAEQWAAESHLLPSPHPTLPLVKHFFFPGFTAESGGLIRELKLIEKRDAFWRVSQTKTDFWEKLGLTDSSTLKVSLFCYPYAPLKDLLEAISEGSRPTIVYVPDSNVLPFLEAVDGQIIKDNLTLQALPFLTQDDYDQLLWACDINFVRGEDSWIRGLWAARPMVWQPYRQEQDTHLSKLQAFLKFYSSALPASAAKALHQIHASWSSNQFEKADWQTLLDNLPAIQTHATRQSEKLALQPDLAAKLVIFCKNFSK
jgi:uncharacterized repeat protein (TIGR03837 family)